MARTAIPELASVAASRPVTSPRPPINLVEAKKKRPAKAVRVIHSIFQSFPILSSPSPCRFHSPLIPRGPASPVAANDHLNGATRTMGTLFGNRRSRCITLAIQENPHDVPIHLLDLGMPTGRFMQKMAVDHLRVVLECEKSARWRKKKLLDEPLWEAYVNGRTVANAVRREPSERDLKVIQMLCNVSMGAGVLPDDMTDAREGERTYMRVHFDRVTGNKDSETFYMLNPDGSYGPELTIFFIRV